VAHMMRVQQQSIDVVYLAALITLLVHEKLGLALLRRAWFNLDLILVHGLMVSFVLIIMI
jgi:hypothetical protein